MNTVITLTSMNLIMKDDEKNHYFGSHVNDVIYYHL